jgi:hypothetical protein
MGTTAVLCKLFAAISIKLCELFKSGRRFVVEVLYEMNI